MKTTHSLTRVHQRLLSFLDRIQWLPPLGLRIVLGVTFLLSGWGKLHNLDQIEQYFASLHIPAAGVQAPFVATVEFVGGILILAGLATRLFALLLVGVMAVAIYTAIWPEAEGVTAVLGSIEAAYLAGFVYLGVNGAGAASLDRLAAHFVPALRAPQPSHA